MLILYLKKIVIRKENQLKINFPEISISLSAIQELQISIFDYTSKISVAEVQYVNLFLARRDKLA